MNTLQIVPSWPVVGNLLPDFELPSSDGQAVGPSDYRNRRNLVLVFAGEPDANAPCELLLDLARYYSDVIQENAEALAVMRGTVAEAVQIKQSHHLPFPVLADEDGQVHHAYAAVTFDGRASSVAVYVAGVFGKVYLASRAADTPALPTAHDILGTLRVIEAQCPECGREEL